MRTRIFLALLVLAVLPATAEAQTPRQTGPFVKLNIQAPQLVAEVPVHFEGGDPESWTMSVVLPGPEGDQEIARGSGTGNTTRALLPVTDPEWRWRFIEGLDRQVFVRINYRAGGQSRQGGGLTMLAIHVNAGRYDGSQRPPLPGYVGLYTGPGDLHKPSDLFYETFGKLVHRRTRTTTFAAGSRLRRRVTLPFVVPPEGVRSVAVEVVDVNAGGPGRSPAVYKGRASVPATAKPGTSMRVKAKLTRRGARLARRAGARRLARRLKRKGSVNYTTRSNDEEFARKFLWVPLGTCFPEPQKHPRLPCKQTCPRFPGMPTGFLLYDAIGGVTGGSRCTRGAPLFPMPLS